MTASKQLVDFIPFAMILSLWTFSNIKMLECMVFSKVFVYLEDLTKRSLFSDRLCIFVLRTTFVIGGGGGKNIISMCTCFPQANGDVCALLVFQLIPSWSKIQLVAITIKPSNHRPRFYWLWITYKCNKIAHVSLYQCLAHQCCECCNRITSIINILFVIQSFSCNLSKRR